MEHRDFKDRLYSQFARVGQALASPKRLELLDLLAQAPRHVDALSEEMDLSVASVSQHIQVLRRAELLEASREGTRTVYRLADKRVLQLYLSLRAVAEGRLAEVERINRGARPGEEPYATRESLLRQLESGEVLVVDVRPPVEFEHGHLPGALSVPLEELPQQLGRLPKDKELVVYCRGAYCLWADDALTLLRQKGFKVRRLEGGWEEWWDENRPIQDGSPSDGTASHP